MADFESLKEIKPAGGDFATLATVEFTCPDEPEEVFERNLETMREAGVQVMACNCFMRGGAWAGRVQQASVPGIESAIHQCDLAQVLKDLASSGLRGGTEGQRKNWHAAGHAPLFYSRRCLA